MKLSDLSKKNVWAQIAAIKSGFPLKALLECARLLRVKPSKLASALKITRKPKKVFRPFASEKIFRAYRAYSQVRARLGDGGAQQWLHAPAPGLRNPATPFDLFVSSIATEWAVSLTAEIKNIENIRRDQQSRKRFKEIAGSCPDLPHVPAHLGQDMRQ